MAPGAVLVHTFRPRITTVVGIDNEVVYYPHSRPWTWRPLHRAYKRKKVLQEKEIKMAEVQRTETILRNLAQDLLSKEECYHFKEALHHFRVSRSVMTLCQQLKPIINTTQKILLLVELSTRMPKNLQEDFHRLCGLQYPNYDTYLKIFSNGNASHEMPRVIAQDSSGKFKIISQGNEKKMMMKYNNQKQKYELHSLPGTSVTSGIYSNASSDSDDDDDFDTVDYKDSSGRITPVHLKGKKNVHKVFLCRHGDGSYGLGINGGKEYGTDIIINVVEEGGPAATQGLEVGDKILEVNGQSFSDISHVEAVLVMRNAWNLIMLIERPEEKSHQNGTDVPDFAQPFRRVQDLELIVYPMPSGRLGCITQRLASQDLIVKRVEENSPASKAGVMTNDLIIKVDNINVKELSEAQIVMLTHAKRMVLSVKRDSYYIDGPDYSQMNHTSHTYVPPLDLTDAPPEKHRRINQRSESEPRSDHGRDHSAESKPSSHHSSHYIVNKKENRRPKSASSPHVLRRTLNKPDHFVYSTRANEKANWVLSAKPREHRYLQKKDTFPKESFLLTFPQPLHGRSHSEGNYHVIDTGVSNGRYIRHRSYSPHRNALTVNRIHNEDNVIRAIQSGLEKRQRAIRLSLYQMPDPADYEWEI